MNADFEEMVERRERLEWWAKKFREAAQREDFLTSLEDAAGFELAVVREDKLIAYHRFLEAEAEISAYTRTPREPISLEECLWISRA